jgi:hypothetical protein
VFQDIYPFVVSGEVQVSYSLYSTGGSLLSASRMDSFSQNNPWASQVDGQHDSTLESTTPLDFTIPLDFTRSYQPDGHPASTTLAGSNHQVNDLPSLTGPVVQTYHTPANLPQLPLSPYMISSGPSQLPGLPTLHPTVVFCRFCGQVTGAAAVAAGPPLLLNGNYSLLQTLDGRRQWVG